MNISLAQQPSADSFADFRTIDLRGSALTGVALSAVMPRPEMGGSGVEAPVAAILADVRERGLVALTELALRFDGVEQASPRVPREALTKALAELAPDVRLALAESIDRARRFAAAQVPDDVEVEISPGAVVTHKWIAVRRVGLYVPGGLAVYPSSVVMNVVPAQAAGVESIALASPPQKEFGGLPHPVILAAAEMLGITEVYAIGGAQAIAAFAYGVDGGEGDDAIDRVDVVTGPGNIYVATAKRLLKGTVGIDSEAGTTEIAILADNTADPRLIAADLISQAEHDPNAASVLITDSEDLAARVRGHLSAQIATTKHADRVREALAGQQSGTILVDDVEHGIAVCDAYAAEHLEIQTADAALVASRIRNAGAVFVGDYSPVSLGDYCAGSNHVLPTGGTASFASGLNVTTFLKAVQLINYNRSALEEVSQHITSLATAEDLPAHGDAVTARFH
ncbi:histidinol dehydrogenase [Arthrobacter sp. Bz4]|uniref:histidinol dehydrogenase n=1 Tax=Arthrobacter sp. Bz4 TaxID=2171979 RepID=UPI000D51DC89|nr:histidinol dehydrogenase [Arthrobacter sp. Bz4]PVE19472.1 histidinol dehydrogenase [Arthrobacter sp. Bz4]